MKKAKLLQVRLDETDLEMVKRLADAEKRTVSSYVRWLISLAVDKKTVLMDASREN